MLQSGGSCLPKASQGPDELGGGGARIRAFPCCFVRSFSVGLKDGTFQP